MPSRADLYHDALNDSHHCHIEAKLLSAWAIEQGATTSQRHRILGLLDFQWFCAQPLPPRIYYRAGVPDPVWFCYLFRCHIGAIPSYG
jgi:hypothetical protein